MNTIGLQGKQCEKIHKNNNCVLMNKRALLQRYMFQLQIDKKRVAPHKS